MRVLVLDKVYQPIGFIGYRKMAKKVAKDKVEIIATWDGVAFRKDIDFPSIVREKNYIRKRPIVAKFSFKGVYKRDNYTCFPSGVRILMANGCEKDISKIEINDQICDAFGKIETVTAVGVNKSSNVVAVKIRGSYEKLLVTSDHPFLTNDYPIRFDNIYNLESLSCKDAKHVLALRNTKYQHDNNDIFIYNHLPMDREYKVLNGFIYHINASKNKVPLMIKKSKDLSYLLGLYVAEGSVSGKIGSGMTATWTFNIKEHDTLAKDVKKALYNVFGLNAVIDRRENVNTCIVRVSSSVLACFLESVCGKKSHGKIVPNCLGSYTKDFIKGLFLGDGYIKHSKNKIVLDLTSKSVVHSTRVLLWNFGIHPTIDTVKRVGKRQVWQLILQGENYSKFCNDILDIKVQNRKKNFGSDNYLYNVVKSITPLDDEYDVYNFETSGSHTYIANGICVHNCQYTGEALMSSELNIDHVIPKSRGGASDWKNCVVSSKKINEMKADRLPEEAGLKLLNPPRPPDDPIALEYSIIPKVHDDWPIYFAGVKRRLRKKII